MVHIAGETHCRRQSHLGSLLTGPMGEDLRFGEGFGAAQDSFPVAPPQSSLAPFATRISYRRCGHDLLGTIVPLASFYQVVFHRLYGALNIDQVTNGCSKLTQRTGSLFLKPKSTEGMTMQQRNGR